jgi:hypothetical protein
MYNGYCPNDANFLLLLQIVWTAKRLEQLKRMVGGPSV